MTLDSIADSIANQADDLLADAASVSEARANLAELLSSKYPKLSGVERQSVINGVIRILQDEGFFEVELGGNAGAHDELSQDTD